MSSISGHFEHDLPWTEKCVCGKRFSQPGGFSLHVGKCSDFKNRLGKRMRQARERRATRDVAVDQEELNHEESEERRRKRARWLDDTDLEVDSVSTPEPGRQSKPIADSPMRLVVEQEEAVPLDVPQTLGRGHRKKMPTYKVQGVDFQPTSLLPTSLFPPPLREPPPTPHPEPSHVVEEALDDGVGQSSTPDNPVASERVSKPNRFGLFKRYTLYQEHDFPHDPDLSTTPEDLREGIPPTDKGSDPPGSRNPWHPYPNFTAFRLGEWFWSDDFDKSERSFRALLDIIEAEDFKSSDIRDVPWTRIDRELADSQVEKEEGNWEDEGVTWRRTTLRLNVPFPKGSKEPGTQPYVLEGFHHRPLVPLIRSKLESASGHEYFHTLGYDLRWKPREGQPDVRVYGEMYSSKAFQDAYRELQASPPEPGCSLPRYVIGLMFGSDATMLASFGTAKVWPLYLFFGNDSKYRRAKPSEKLFETVAYFETLGDLFKEFLVDKSGKSSINQNLLTMCSRELFHEQLKVILDEEFLHAYKHGIVVTCQDGKQRRFYPRILTWSADYPEKVLLASIKNLGAFPCPRCTVSMADVPKMGTKSDLKKHARLVRVDNSERKDRIARARALVYEGGLSLTAAAVVGPLAEGSLVPVANAFSSELSPYGFNLFRMLVVDVMHEVELGVWKALFIQLLRLLEAVDRGKGHVLDARYRRVPTFGRDTIRRFANNVSEMKQFAARNFEDILQCAIPVFEGLLPPPHNARVLTLLFEFATWHGLAKLRMHTEYTLDLLEKSTVKIGEQMRQFVESTCKAFDTKELDAEYRARQRREVQSKDTSKSRFKESKESRASSVAGKKSKTLNLNTYKFHSMGDVAPTIREFGTSDSYNTQIPERFHRYPKTHYRRTNKKDVHRQLSRIQTRQSRLKKLRSQVIPEKGEEFRDDDAFKLPYFIGKSQNNPLYLSEFFQRHSEDPATKNFSAKLRAHLLPRLYRVLMDEAKALFRSDGAESASSNELNECLTLLQSLLENAEASGEASLAEEANLLADVNRIVFHGERIYQHHVFHVNYTSYDVRRETDVVNPKTSRRDVMCLRIRDEDDGSQHFAYARVMGIFHANVVYRGEGSLDFLKRRFDFLWVRWYATCEASNSAEQALERLRLLPVCEEGATGFLDPAVVLRASHIVPWFFLGQRYPSHEGGNGDTRIYSHNGRDRDDWHEYYVNRFVDRDMLMRYHWGYGVGHLYCRENEARSPFSRDKDQGEVPGKAPSTEEEFEDTTGTEALAAPTESGASPDDHSEEKDLEEGEADTLEDKERIELEVLHHQDLADDEDSEEESDPEADSEFED